jgi:hypothetical protein
MRSYTLRARATASSSRPRKFLKVSEMVDPSLFGGPTSAVMMMRYGNTTYIVTYTCLPDSTFLPF